MYLKKIIINGFKSFADKVTLTLDKHHISGIVGPNGSGKSNVIDAVRWVMGEQNTKMLRGEKSTDIIFSGSERRKPLGMAEVTLVFDNTEGSPFCPPEYRHEPEISLTRLVYSDGEREFLMNRKPCRLKDILEFFASTGLGGRSYSMIQQGQVDRILQAKPEEIREIIEEAAGTLVFKRRRTDVQKKLDITGTNLSRIDDIFREIQKRIEELREQVERAQKWKELSESLKEKELSLFYHNAHYYRDTLKNIALELERAQLREVEVTTEIVRGELALQTLKYELEEVDPELSALSEEIAVLRERIASTEASLATILQNLKNSDEEKHVLQTDLDRNLKEFQGFEEQIKENETQKLKSLQDQEHFAGLLDEYDYQISLTDEQSTVFQTKIGELREDLTKTNRLIETNRFKRDNLENEVKKKQKDKQDVSKKLLALESEQSQTTILLESAQLKVTTNQREINELIKEKQDVELQTLKTSDALTDSQKDRDKTKGSFLEAKANYLSLKEWEDTQLSPSIVLGEMIERNPNQKFSLNALTEGITLDRECLEPLIHKVAEITKGALLDQILRFSKETPVALILEDSRNHTAPYHARISIGGQQGSPAQKEKLANFLNQMLSLEQLLEQKEKLVVDLERKQKDLRQELNQLDGKLQHKNRQQIEFLAELQGLKQHTDHKRELIIEARREFNQLDEVCELLQSQLEEIYQNNELLGKERDSTRKDLEDLEFEISDIEDKRAELKRLSEQTRIDLASAKNLAESLEKMLVQSRKQIQLGQERYERSRGLLETFEQRLASQKASKEEYEKALETFFLGKEEKEEFLLVKKEKNSALVEQLRKAESALKRQQEERQGIHKLLNEKGLDQERTRIAWEAILQTAKEKYQLDLALEENQGDPQPPKDTKASQKEIAEIKQVLDNFGPINMMAVEEYGELKSRKEFIEAQKDEILASIELLQTAIEEIENSSKAKFISTFETLNHEFKSLFPILFPNGEGAIQLTQPELPLESGVEIMVRLPGKNRQSMRLFSGGEKALTAIALIFALLKSKPTPFCFLDEVDAPLDETNVVRYNRVLEALSDRFQFIVITHRRRTMEVLDTLYGVTMQEPGVSKVVGVDLSKELPTHLQKAFKESNLNYSQLN